MPRTKKLRGGASSRNKSSNERKSRSRSPSPARDRYHLKFRLRGVDKISDPIDIGRFTKQDFNVSKQVKVIETKAMGNEKINDILKEMISATGYNKSNKLGIHWDKIKPISGNPDVSQIYENREHYTLLETTMRYTGGGKGEYAEFQIVKLAK